MNFVIERADSLADIEDVRQLFRDYAADLDIDLGLQGLAAELARLPGQYAPPSGDLLLARTERGEAAGCVALRSLPIAGICELKRLYVLPAARGSGLGRTLAKAAIERAAAIGYRQIVLDTLPGMAAAITLYHSLGFAPIPPYADPVYPGTLFFGRKLAGQRADRS
jgi:ribosomal protein S18 acetylase RimI-like enzyme